jgi:hypothetical protein
MAVLKEVSTPPLKNSANHASVGFSAFVDADQ